MAFYLRSVPTNFSAAAGVWHLDGSAHTKIRMPIVAGRGRWAWATRKLELEDDSLMRRP